MARVLEAALLVSVVTAVPRASTGLYGIANTGAALPGALLSVDPTTGETSAVGGALGPYLVAQELSTIDQVTQTYFIIGYDPATRVPNLVGVSLANGSVTSVAPLGFAEDSLVGVGQNIAWEPDTGSVVVSGENAAGDHLFGLVDPATGRFTQRAQLNCTEPKCLPVLGSPADYAPDSKVYLTQLGTGNDIDFLAVNMSSGSVYSTVDCDTVETLDYDKASGSFFGIGLLTSPSVERVLVRLSPDAKTCSVVGAIPNYFMIGAGVSALDEAAGVLYWIAAPGGFPVNYTLNVYNLVGTRLADASTASEAPFCCFGGCQPPATQPDCPWSLEFNNGAA